MWLLNASKIFLSSNNLSPNVLQLPPKILNDYLRYFYSQLRTQDNQFYAPASLICIRAAIHRYFCLERPTINIITDSWFSQSNRMLKSMVVKYKTSGQPKTSQPFPVIESSDMQRIRQYFDRSCPEILQQEIIFNCIYYFG
jgi:hypothetical protein